MAQGLMKRLSLAGFLILDVYNCVGGLDLVEWCEWVCFERLSKEFFLMRRLIRDCLNVSEGISSE